MACGCKSICGQFCRDAQINFWRNFLIFDETLCILKNKLVFLDNIMIPNFLQGYTKAFLNHKSHPNFTHLKTYQFLVFGSMKSVRYNKQAMNYWAIFERNILFLSLSEPKKIISQSTHLKLFTWDEMSHLDNY